MTYLQCITVCVDGTVKIGTNEETSLQYYQNEVGGYIEAIEGDGWSAFINEEGKIQGLERNLFAEVWMRYHGMRLGQGDWIAGNVVFTGPPDLRGETTHLGMDIVLQLTDYFRAMHQLNLELMADEP